jgi:hypothetical protein
MNAIARQYFSEMIFNACRSSEGRSRAELSVGLRTDVEVLRILGGVNIFKYVRIFLRVMISWSGRFSLIAGVGQCAGDQNHRF